MSLDESGRGLGVGSGLGLGWSWKKPKPPGRSISGSTAITGLLSYSRAMISMFFLRYLGEMELVGGSLSIGFANITHYSVIAGLAMGVEPICGQAYRAKQMKILGLTPQRTILLLLSTSFLCHSHGLT
ncbi:unnamed protein product [Lupinus luteus]|uniref:Uncharacterized protein n=1 Tax=Lupinus luteus TaxID=3873 RepID=A0AAV1VXV1_LUPLU